VNNGGIILKSGEQWWNYSEKWLTMVELFRKVGNNSGIFLKSGEQWWNYSEKW